MVKSDAPNQLEGSVYKEAKTSPGFLFWTTFNTWQRLIRDELEKLELTQAQYSILAATSYLGSSQTLVSQQDVANQLCMDKMTVSDVVKTLVSKKYLTRRPHPEDGRAFVLFLTPLAKAKLKVAVPKVESIDEGFFGKLGNSDRTKLLEILVTLSST